MESEEIQFCHKELRINSIEVDPIETALIIKYEVTVRLIGKDEQPILEESKELQKIIRVRDLTEDCDVKLLAADIMEKCTVLPLTKAHEIEQSLFYLQKRKPTSASVQSDQSKHVRVHDYSLDGGVHSREDANISSLDAYIELLYEDIPEKVKASAMVLQLARKPNNLTLLSKNEILLGALARVLREDSRKSIELTTNIVYIFFCFSKFRQMHHVISQFKVGSLCMDIIDNEVKRCEQWANDLAKKKETIDRDKNLVAEVVDVFDYPVPFIVNDYEKSNQKYIVYVKKQDQFLRVAFYLLYNISEDIKVEIKMINRGIIKLLTKCLKRQLDDLIVIVLTFLKKLSLYIENKEEFVQNNVLENLTHLVPHENSDVLNMTLRLLWNLSFDNDLRNGIVRCGFVPKFIKLINVDRHFRAALGILYHISMEDRYKTLLTYIDCIGLVVRMIIQYPTDTLYSHLIAFGINLAANKRNAQLILDEDCLGMFMGRAFRLKDSLLMKMIRNISQHDGTKEHFLVFVDDLCEEIMIPLNNDDFVLECLGILGNLSLTEIDFEKVLVQYNLIDYMIRRFTLNLAEDDFLLELIIFAGTAASEEACALMILESGVLKHVIDFLNARQEDDEIVLQIVYLFYRLIYHSVTRPTVANDSQIPLYLLDLLHDKNPEIRRFCDYGLDMISATSTLWENHIRLEKFRFHNCQWLEMIESQQIEENDGCYMDESYIPNIQESSLLDQSELCYSSGAFESLLSDIDPPSTPILPDYPGGGRHFPVKMQGHVVCTCGKISCNERDHETEVEVC